MKQFILSGLFLLIGLVHVNAQKPKVHINHTAIFVIDINASGQFYNSSQFKLVILYYE